jgi:hypothetical protein
MSPYCPEKGMAGGGSTGAVARIHVRRLGSGSGSMPNHAWLVAVRSVARFQSAI